MIGRGVEVVVESMKLLPSEGRGRKMRLFLMLMAVGAAISCTPVKSEVRGSNLREIIEDQIRKNVRESYGELAGENFSWDDLEQFHRNKVPEKIGNLLRASVRFRAAVDEVRSMVAADRDSYLRRCRLPLRNDRGGANRRGRNSESCGRSGAGNACRWARRPARREAPRMCAFSPSAGGPSIPVRSRLILGPPLAG